MRSHRFDIGCLAAMLVLPATHAAEARADGPAVFRAGAAAVDISPREFPVRIVGGFLERTATRIVDPLHARSLVLDDGTTRVAIVVVDNCLIPRELYDAAKEQAARSTGIPTDRMLMSATHTHSGPAVVGALGTDVDEKYPAILPGLIAQAVERAARNLAPARIGWGVVPVPEHTHCRRWIRRPDRLDLDPFGHRTVRAMMHPRYNNPDYLGPSGPADPELSIVSVQAADGRPIALLANYSMHYVGAEPVSADYFGAFAEKIGERIGAGTGDPPFVGILSNGTSGDSWYMDYSKPPRTHTVESLADAMAQAAAEAYRRIEHRTAAPITMREAKLTLTVRPIPQEDFARAKEAFARVGERQPQKFEEVYPREQVLLSRMPPSRELKLQALRIGELGITAIPCEVFALTGLKIKAYSPLRPTFTIELANGYDGYIPPPEQHRLGGYTTWRARSSCLEVEAEPKILAATLDLLEQVAGKPRRTPADEDYPFGDYPSAVLASKPVAYWRLNEFGGTLAADATGHGHPAEYVGTVAYYLDGAAVAPPRDPVRINRAPQLAGGCVKARLAELRGAYSVELWAYNCMPVDARPVTGCLVQWDGPGAEAGRCLVIGGTSGAAGRLQYHDRASAGPAGKTEIRPHTWHHVALVCDGKTIRVHLDGNPVPEITHEIADGMPADRAVMVLGGDDPTAALEGRVDEAAVYDRALSPEEIARHFAAASAARS